MEPLGWLAVVVAALPLSVRLIAELGDRLERLVSRSRFKDTFHRLGS